MSKIIVLGGGMVGSAMAIDLSTKHQVTLADQNNGVLQKVQQRCRALTTMQLDVTNRSNLLDALKNHDLVICAVPGFLGYNTLKWIIEAGKDVVDISFFAEDALSLDELARQKGVTAVVDCGVAPGMGNIILGYYDTLMDISSFECLVGGLPKARKWPFAYKAPFSPVDVIEEYTRPARYVEHGQLVVREALSDCEHVCFEGVGTLESFNSDGLRTLIFTMGHIPNMKEKTLRYPGHVDYVRALKESGFFDTKEILVNGVKLNPRQFTSKILFDEWKLGKNEEEFTVMRISISGKNRQGIQQKVIYHLYDEFDAENGVSSMARTTGYTATAVANLLLDGHFQNRGVFPPEWLGKNALCFHYVLKYLEDRGVKYSRTEKAT
jgi:lysine 6-dehydrogenase